MFYDVFVELCERKGVKPTAAVKEIGYSNSLATKWKKTGATPNTQTLSRIAEYFGVPIEYLIGQTENDANLQTIRADKTTIDVLNQFNQLSDADKDMVVRFMQTLSASQSKSAMKKQA